MLFTKSLKLSYDKYGKTTTIKFLISSMQWVYDMNIWNRFISLSLNFKFQSEEEMHSSS